MEMEMEMLLKMETYEDDDDDAPRQMVFDETNKSLLNITEF